MSFPSENYASSVCIPCKRRKKRCDKALPNCSRCSRFNTYCSYSALNTSQNTRSNLTQTITEYAFQSMDSVSSGTLRHSSILSTYELPTVNELTTSRLESLAECMSPGGAKDYANYFTNLHISLPFMNQEDFYLRLESSTPDQSFAGIMLAMSLVAQLSSREEDASTRAKEIYPTLKSAYTHYGVIDTPTVDLLQTGILISIFEYCQGFHQEAWMTIGMCARMSQILRQEIKDSKLASVTGEEQHEEPHAVLWYTLAILERIFSFDYMENKLPHITEPPKANDILPGTSQNNNRGLEVTHNLFLATDVDKSKKFEFKSGESTNLNPFATTVQATYLSNLVTDHIRGSTYTDVRQIEKLDLILQSFGGSLIPPAGKAVGHYCGSYSIQTCSLFYLHEEELKVATRQENFEQIARSTAALRSLARIIIFVVKASTVGVPFLLDFVAFWAHKIVYYAAMNHIKFGKRDQDWHEDLETCKSYLRYFAPRYNLHSDYLRKIEAEQARMRG